MTDMKITRRIHNELGMQRWNATFKRRVMEKLCLDRTYVVGPNDIRAMDLVHDDRVCTYYVAAWIDERMAGLGCS